MTSTVIQVGKALNDPAKGLTALRRVGVAFTKDQEKKIKSLQKEGKLYEAQQLILKELNKEFGGSFAAQGDTTAGKVAKFHDAVEDLQRTFAKALLPVIVKVADKLGALFVDPKVVALIDEAGKGLARAFDGVLAAAEKINWGAIAGGLRRRPGLPVNWSAGSTSSPTGRRRSSSAGSLPPSCPSSVTSSARRLRGSSRACLGSTRVWSTSRLHRSLAVACLVLAQRRLALRAS